jgi:hypothetical protein
LAALLLGLLGGDDGGKGGVLVLVLRGYYSPGKGREGLVRGEEVDSILIGRRAEFEQVDV